MAATQHAGDEAAGRDGFMDLLRAGALLVVVIGHWLGTVPAYHDGVITGLMVYDVDARYWPATWVFDVLPLFFFVGGFANAVSYRRLRDAGKASTFRSRRLTRLLTPTLAFIGFWIAVEAMLNTFDVGGPGPIRGMRFGFMTPFAPLWFLGVYLIVVLLVPATLALHERFGLLMPSALLAGVLLVDWSALGAGHPRLLGLNIVLVWLLPNQLGYFYADGRLQRLRARTWAWIGLLLSAVLLALTTLPWYSRNLLDTGVTIIGITAPTLPFAIISVLMIALAMLVRRPLADMRRNPALLAIVGRLTSWAMTVFLWHMTSYFAAVALLAAVPIPLPSGPDLTWWLERPIFLLLPAALLLPLLWAFGRFERSSHVRGSAGYAAQA